GSPSPVAAARRERRPPRQALTPADRERVLAVLHEGRFVDLPPAQVWAQLLDAGQVPPCSIRTMYRVLAAHAEVRERRNQLRPPIYHKPELLATGPNQVWSWDITKLLGPVKWTSVYLYVLLDIFSRYIVGWLLARQESATLAKVLIAESCERQPISPDQLSSHSRSCSRSHAAASTIATSNPGGQIRTARWSVAIVWTPKSSGAATASRASRSRPPRCPAGSASITRCGSRWRFRAGHRRRNSRPCSRPRPDDIGSSSRPWPRSAHRRRP